jgi:hypothetical protein
MLASVDTQKVQAMNCVHALIDYAIQAGEIPVDYAVLPLEYALVMMDDIFTAEGLSRLLAPSYRRYLKTAHAEPLKMQQLHTWDIEVRKLRLLHMPERIRLLVPYTSPLNTSMSQSQVRYLQEQFAVSGGEATVHAVGIIMGILVLLNLEELSKALPDFEEMPIARCALNLLCEAVETI